VPGIVDQDVEPAQFHLSSPHQPLDLLSPGQVRPVVQRPHPAGRDRGPLALDRVGFAKAVEHDVGTLGGQRFGRRQADAGRGAGDEGGLALQEHGCALLARVWAIPSRIGGGCESVRATPFPADHSVPELTSQG
jgi:hypothetical protein